MHWWWWNDGGALPFFGMFLGPLTMIAVIVVTILIIAYLVRAFAPNANPSAPEKTALDILKERFARGEIDRNEYEDRKRLLSA